jgi:hypothetical protein
MERIHHTVYKITNKVNEMFYVGVHSTFNPLDRYFGSGVEIREALREFGKRNFVKEILFDFETEREMLDKEAEIVNKDFILREDTYNRAYGGGGRGLPGRVSVRDPLTGETQSVSVNDPRYLSGELVSVMKGMITVKDLKSNKCFVVTKDDPRFETGEIASASKGQILAREVATGKASMVDLTDKRLQTGEVVYFSKGRNHTEETKEKTRKSVLKYLQDRKEHPEKYGGPIQHPSKKHTAESIEKMKQVRLDWWKKRKEREAQKDTV